MKGERIARPDWLKECSLATTLRLYSEGKIPPTIERQMLVVPIKHALRSIYGTTNVRVALRLLWDGTCSYWSQRWIDFRFRMNWLTDDEREWKREWEAEQQGEQSNG